MPQAMSADAPKNPELKVFGKEGSGERTFLQKGFSPAFWALAPEYACQVLDAYRLAQTPPESLANANLARMGRELDAAEYANQLTELRDGVAVIHIDGPIDRQSRVSWFTGSIYSLGQDAILAAIRAALADASVGAILLSINSPGGVVAGTKELADFIAEARDEKPMAAYVNGLAASAAFWLAAATGRIMGPQTAQVGSVGVIMAIPNLAGFYQKMGVKLEYIASGKFKTAGRGDRDLTDEERDYFQNQIGALHEIFKSDTRQHLGITRADSEWAEAQLFLAEDAARLGLLAEITRDEESAILKLKEEMMPQKITMELLEAEAPDLLAQIRAEAAENAKRDPGLDEAAKADVALAVIRAICPAEKITAAENLFTLAAKLKLDGSQASELFAAFRAMPPQDGTTVASLRAAYPDSLNSEPQKTAKCPLTADAERRAQKEKV